MKKKILLIFLGVLFLVGCSNGKAFKESYEALNGKKNSSGKIHRTITIDEDNPFKEVSADKIVKMIENKETFYVYFGDELCPWCRSVIEKFIEVAKKNDVKKVYYVKIWDEEGNEILRDKYKLDENNNPVLDSKGTEAYTKLLKYFDNVLSDYNLTSEDGKSIYANEKRIYAPNFMYVEDGKCIKKAEGISDKQKDAREELSKEILEDEERLFNEFFKK